MLEIGMVWEVCDYLFMYISSAIDWNRRFLGSMTAAAANLASI